MAIEREAWLKLTQEAPIDPELPICDPHHHLWDYPNNRYLLDELLCDTEGGHSIVQTVFVECGSNYRWEGSEDMQPVGETEFVQGIATQSESGQYGKIRVAAGIVGFADLTLGAAVKPVLEAHIVTGKGKFRGIRHISANPYIGASANIPELLLDSKFREGFVCLQEYDLSFDAWLYHPQLMGLVDLAKAFPDTSIILDHIGSPLGIGPYAGRREEVFEKWKKEIVALATCSNVVVKLGGLGMPFCGFGWHERAIPPGSTELADTMAPYFHWCIEHFGVDRCMFESNFPADKTSYSYTVMWNAFKRVSRGFSPQDQSALFHDTAVRVYRLKTNNEG